MPRAMQGLEKLWETWRINTTVRPEISPPCALRETKATET